jgi:hypothetical protein
VLLTGSCEHNHAPCTFKRIVEKAIVKIAFATYTAAAALPGSVQQDGSCERGPRHQEHVQRIRFDELWCATRLQWLGNPVQLKRERYREMHGVNARGRSLGLGAQLTEDKKGQPVPRPLSAAASCST